MDFSSCARLVILRLSRPERAILPLLVAEERLVRAGLRDRAMIEHGDPVAEAAGGQPVTDLDRGASAGDVTEAAVHLILRHRIQRRRWVRPAT